MYFAGTNGTENQEGPTTPEEGINFFIEYWNDIDWEGIFSSIILFLMQLILTLIIFFILKKLGNYAIELVFKRYMKEKQTVPNRLNTLYKLSKNSFHAIIYFFLVYAILELMGVPVGTLVASAGVVGLALSLGAQGFVSDIVNGFMILLEKQLDVGDVVELSGILGTVEDVNLKTTKVRDFDGTTHFIPNRSITVISNRSRADMRVMLHVRLFPETDLNKVRAVLEQVNREWIPRREEITIEPSEISFVPIGAGQIAAQVIMYTKSGTEFAMRNLFYEKYVDALREAGIELPKVNLDIQAP
ncbi:mechanosensitive ion channel family protein [Alkalibacterium pelagium]|uniref:Small conductance mechanosensitive channel n=1 Tax=Alkalibacterium pelagium TaxID=426702 RepID=A0A1H7MZB0_9LACT|nr:mechanosensitive ion channel family protein [Alkalibacterium pelagium]GEN51272.1 mechanosensitive ion channel protein MscS [Alkalibacterium pelagium]SEL16666.1 small conductance mechanosensitive channel [Alkalibacterium pelagium]